MYDCFIDWIEIILSLRLVFLKYTQKSDRYLKEIDVLSSHFQLIWLFLLGLSSLLNTCVYFSIFIHILLFVYIYFFFLPLHFVSWDFIVFSCMYFRLRFFTVPVCKPCIDQQSDSTWFNWQTAVVWQSSGLSTASQW